MAGRPRKTWADEEIEMFKKLCGIMCTKKEVCAILELDPKTLDKLVADTFPDTPTWAEAYDCYSASGAVSLRRKQFEVAMSGDRTMLIFLGKNYLGQSDQGAKEEQKPRNPSVTIVGNSKWAKGRAANG